VEHLGVVVAEAKMKKNAIYLIILITVIAVAGFFLFGNSQSSAKEGNNQISAGGEVQQVTLGIKNYNYYPQEIRVKSGEPVRISLDSSVSGCYRSFTLREFGVAKYLASPSDYVEFTPTKKGTFTFACSMGMGTGKLIVE